MAHDEFLAVKICQGLRPKFIIKVPQLLEDIFKQCVDADPLKRPTAEYLYGKFSQCRFNDLCNSDSEIWVSAHFTETCFTEIHFVEPILPKFILPKFHMTESHFNEMLFCRNPSYRRDILSKAISPKIKIL